MVRSRVGGGAGGGELDGPERVKAKDADTPGGII